MTNFLNIEETIGTYSAWEIQYMVEGTAKITIKEFMAWLSKSGNEESFKQDLKAYGTENPACVAVDYGIPVIMVKYFTR